MDKLCNFIAHNTEHTAVMTEEMPLNAAICNN